MTKLYIVSNYIFKVRPKHNFNINKAFYKTLLLSITIEPMIVYMENRFIH